MDALKSSHTCPDCGGLFLGPHNCTSSPPLKYEVIPPSDGSSGCLPLVPLTEEGVRRIFREEVKKMMDKVIELFARGDI